MKRAPTSLKARVGPWNSSKEYMLGSTSTTGQSKARVSYTIFFRESASTSSPKKASATRYAISWKESFSMLSKKSRGSFLMFSGM